MSSRHLLLLAVGLCACRPDFGLPVSVITDARVLSVVVTPPEARPGDSVTFVATPVSEHGPSGAPLDFAWCTSPRPLTEDNVISADCLGGSGQNTPIASGVTAASALIPLDACARFGPDTPPQPPGQPPLRPRDPDVTGGYYQPLRVVLSDEVQAVALVRVRCALPGASAQRAAEFSSRYVDNTNPTASPISLTRRGEEVSPHAVPPSATLRLQVRWPDTSAEHYLVHRRTDDTLVEHREALRVSWFTTAGEIPVVTTGRAEDDQGTDASTEWKTPASGSGTLWAVVRDSRGGSSVTSLDFTVQ